MLKKLTSKTSYYNHLLFSCYSNKNISVEIKQPFLLDFEIPNYTYLLTGCIQWPNCNI